MKLPVYFSVDRLTPVTFYGFGSAVKNPIYKINISDDRDNPDVFEFLELKRKCLGMCLETLDGNYEREVWDQMIVIKCKTDIGKCVYVGFDGLNYTIGYDVKHSHWVKPRNYMELKSHKDVLVY